MSNLLSSFAQLRNFGKEETNEVQVDDSTRFNAMINESRPWYTDKSSPTNTGILARLNLLSGQDTENSPREPSDSSDTDTSEYKRRLGLANEIAHTKELALLESYHTCEELQDHVRNLSGKVTEREELLSQLSFETTKLKNRYEELQSQYASLQQDYKDLKKHLEDKQVSQERSIVKWEKQLEDKTATIEKLRLELEGVRKENELHRGRNGKLLKESATIREKLDRQIGQTMQVEAELARTRAANSRLELGLQELVQQGHTHTQAYATEKRALQESKEKALNTASLEAERLQKTVLKTKDELQTVSNELANSQQKLNYCKENLKYWRSQAETSASIIQEKEELINQMRQEIEQYHREQLTQEKKLCEALQRELKDTRDQLITTREEVLRRSHNEEFLQNSINQLQERLDEVCLHKIAAEKAGKSAVAEAKDMENKLDAYHKDTLNMKTHIQDLEKKLDREIQAKLHTEKQLERATGEFQNLLKVQEERHAQASYSSNKLMVYNDPSSTRHNFGTSGLQRSETCIHRVNKELKRSQAVLELSMKKIECLSNELESTRNKLKMTTEELSEIDRLRKKAQEELEQYRSSHQMPDCEATALKRELERIMHESNQLSLVRKDEANQHVDLESQVKKLKNQCSESLSEIKELKCELRSKGGLLESKEQMVRDLQNQLREAQETCLGRNASAVEVTNELRLKIEESHHLQSELKATQSSLQQAELMLQEMEFSVQQLTRQLEQSENLRAEAEQASSQAVAESAAVRIEVAKKDERLISLAGRLEAANQQITSLEKVMKENEMALTGKIKETADKDAIINKLEIDLAGLKELNAENEEELKATRSRLAAFHSELLNAHTSLEEVVSRQRTDDSIRNRLELEVCNLRETKAVLSEQLEHQGQLIERFQYQLRNERARIADLVNSATDRDDTLEKTKLNAQELGRTVDELSSRLRERESAVETLTRELETQTSRLESTAKSLTGMEVELLETKRQLEFSDSRLQKCREEANQYAVIVSGLEARLLERDQTTNMTQRQPLGLLDQSIERSRILQMTDTIRNLKNELMEYKKSSIIAQTERANLQESIQRLQGELVARSDALRQVALDSKRSQREQEAMWADQELGLKETLRRTENNLKEKNEELRKILADLESIKAEKALDKEITDKLKQEKEQLQEQLSSLESNRSILNDRLNKTKQEKSEIQEEYIALMKKMDQTLVDHRETTLALQKKLEEKTQEISDLMKKTTSNLTNRTEKCAQTDYTPSSLKSAQQSSKPERSVSVKVDSVYKNPEIRSTYVFSSVIANSTSRSPHPKSTDETNAPSLSKDPVTDPDYERESNEDIVARVNALKLANQRLRDEVETACKALKNSSLLPERMRAQTNIRTQGSEYPGLSMSERTSKFSVKHSREKAAEDVEHKLHSGKKGSLYLEYLLKRDVDEFKEPKDKSRFDTKSSRQANDPPERQSTSNRLSKPTAQTRSAAATYRTNIFRSTRMH
ncbi:unnamed protein product [Calicophoron daubneyi]|uniref:Uncharacterized protein n=1 Tax=Calicophoron daubneyi TaxID=300641 RepID=A0AAV2T649_CALDB